MRVNIDSGDTTYIQHFNAEKCREEKEKILAQMCITLDKNDKYELSKLTTARQMDQFVCRMINKHWR